jgi:hypothetical protein
LAREKNTHPTTSTELPPPTLPSAEPPPDKANQNADSLRKRVCPPVTERPIRSADPIESDVEEEIDNLEGDFSSDKWVDWSDVLFPENPSSAGEKEIDVTPPKYPRYTPQDRGLVGDESSSDREGDGLGDAAKVTAGCVGFGCLRLIIEAVPLALAIFLAAWLIRKCS